MEAELISANEAAKEAAWMEKVAIDLGELDLDQLESSMKQKQTWIPILHCDNQAATQLTADMKFHNKAKHIEICYIFI